MEAEPAGLGPGRTGFLDPQPGQNSQPQGGERKASRRRLSLSQRQGEEAGGSPHPPEFCGNALFILLVVILGLHPTSYLCLSLWSNLLSPWCLPATDPGALKIGWQLLAEKLLTLAEAKK